MKKKSNRKDVQESLDFIIEHMATKDDVREIVSEMIAELPTRKQVAAIVDEKLKPVTDEMRSMRADIKELKISVENAKGLTKEDDYILTRVSTIEKHIGIKPPVPAEA